MRNSQSYAGWWCLAGADSPGGHGCPNAENRSDTAAPVFYCQLPSKPKGWEGDWNLAFRDTHGGLNQQPDRYHEVVYGTMPTKGSLHFHP